MALMTDEDSRCPDLVLGVWNTEDQGHILHDPVCMISDPDTWNTSIVLLWIKIADLLFPEI